MVHRALIALILTLLWIPQGQARDLNLRVLFGPEFTFQAIFPDTPSQQARTNREVRDLIVARQRSHLIEGQPAGARFSLGPAGYRFISPNGWDFNMSTDPGVVEVQMAPMTWDKFDHFKNDIQDAIFVSAANVGYFPGLFQGGGHINIGTGNLVADSQLLVRNFIADLINHSELFMGVFGYDTNNALPFPLFNKTAQESILYQFTRFDRNEINLDTFIKEFEIHQRGQHDPIDRLWSPTRESPRHKRTAFSMEAYGLDQSGRLELRAVRPQANVQIWVHQIRLLYKRLMYLRQKSKPIPVHVLVPLVSPLEVSFEGQAHALNPPVNVQDALHAFHAYITEVGERWEDHRSYLWPKWITDGEVDRYEQSETFRQVKAMGCAARLADVVL